MAKLITKWIADDAVTKEKLNADVAGAAITQAAGGELDVGVDDTTIEVNTDALRIKDLGVATGKIAATAVTAAKLGSDVAGDGLSGGNGSNLDVDPDVTGGANLARAINVVGNGVSVKVDDDTIGENGSQQLVVKSNSIGANEIDETDNLTFTGTIDITGGTTHVATPSASTHATTKAYVDSLSAGRPQKGAVRALADSNRALTGLPTTIDGVSSWSAGERILLTGQTDPIENGIWEVSATAWNRPDDYATGDSAAGATCWVDQGSTYGEQGWSCTTNAPSDVIDTNGTTWTQSYGLGLVEGGVGLTKSNNTIHVGSGSTGDIGGINRTADDIAVAVDDTTVEVSANVVQVKNLGIATGKIAATAVTAAKLGSDVAGDGLSGGNGSALAADPDAVGGANLASAINVSSNGIAVKINDTTVGENGSNQLEVKDNSIDENKITTGVAGTGLTGGNGTALSIDIAGLTDEATADNADSIIIRDDSDSGNLKEMTRANFLAGAGTGETSYQEAHLITGGEVTNGYFTLAQTPSVVGSVHAAPLGGPPQLNKQVVGGTGATPDFDILSTNQFHFNNNGAAVGLSEDLIAGDVLMVNYTY